MTWGMIGAAAITTVGGAMMSSGGSGGGGGGQQYVGGHMGSADDSWQNSNNSQMDLANAGFDHAVPAYEQSFDRANGLNWDPYLQRAGQSGAAYGQAGDAAMGQMGMYGQQAQQAMGQQGAMYDASGRVLNTAFDPQNALYDRTAQRTQDQIRAGQAARGLGNSETGMMEEAGAMSNFNIDWQNAQLARQSTGIQAAGSAQSAGVAQGRLAGADMSAGLAAGAAGAGYYGQAGSVPLTAQQTWASAPGQAGAQLQSGYANAAQPYANVAGQAIPYMNAGNGAIQGNWQNNYTQNRDMVSGMSQMASAAAPQVASWFGNSGGAGAAQGAFSQTAIGGSGFGTGMAYGNQDMGMFL